MGYANKTFVSFDGDTDMHYYRLMTAWKQHDHMSFNFYNAHDLNAARDSSTEASIKAQLSERLRDSKVFVLLIGESTRYLYKLVKWEIEQATTRKLPIIAVNLNGRLSMDLNRCPSVLVPALAIHISFSSAVMEHALENWPASDAIHRREGKSGAFYYPESVYRGLGL
jgi:hypothetical protein